MGSIQGEWNAGHRIMANRLKMSAIAYVRVSTQEQANGGLSLKDQEQRARDYAKHAGLGDPVILRERGVSGSVPLMKRPQGKILADALAPKGSCTHVIAYKLDRLFRDTEDCLGRIREWQENGVVLHLIDFGGQSYDFGTAMGKFILTFFAAAAEFERNNIRDRTRAAVEYRKKNGLVYGETPYGFRVAEGKRLVPNELERRWIKKMVEWKAEGESLNGIARRLNSSRVQTRRKKKWSGKTVRDVLMRQEKNNG